MLVHVSAFTGHPQRSDLQRNPYVTNTVKDVHVEGWNTMLSIEILEKFYTSLYQNQNILSNEQKTYLYELLYCIQLEHACV